MKKIFVDWDGLKLDDFLNNLEVYLDFEKRINVKEVKFFQTNHGYHLKIYLEKSISMLQNLEYRAALRDDKNRINLSLLKYYISGNLRDFDVLFNMKNGIWEKDYTQQFLKILNYISNIPEDTPNEEVIKNLVKQKLIRTGRSNETIYITLQNNKVKKFKQTKTKRWSIIT
jgi:hypothetical protein